MQGNIYTVTKLNQEIKDLLESNPPFRNIFVQGEISNYKAHTSGHYYMTLKDDGGAVNAVMFRSDAARLRFRPENGMKVIARGRMSAFPKSGQVQLYMADMMPDGAGALHLAFEQRKQLLQKQGLFDATHKRMLPIFPLTIALVTSPTGAALQDVLRILSRRWPLAKVELHASLVQGADAPADLCRALHEANARGVADVIILGRGGGSMEDLWAFNDETLARTIYDSAIPVVSAVGHEPDITIADYVADLRAPTPSAAAELVVPDRADIVASLRQRQNVLHTGLLQSTATYRQRLQAMQTRLHLRAPQRLVEERRMLLDHETERLLLRSPQYRIATMRDMLHNTQDKMHRQVQRQTLEKRNHVTACIATLDALSPLKVLLRGYAVAVDETGRAVQDSRQLAVGQRLDVRFAHGQAQCTVMETRNENAKKRDV